MQEREKSGVEIGLQMSSDNSAKTFSIHIKKTTQLILTLAHFTSSSMNYPEPRELFHFGKIPVHHPLLFKSTKKKKDKKLSCQLRTS